MESQRVVCRPRLAWGAIYWKKKRNVSITWRTILITLSFVTLSVDMDL